MAHPDDTALDGSFDQRWIDLSFGTIFGHARAVGALRERVRTRRRDTSIILHGPSRVGKLTLARLYARALLCEAPTEAGEACRSCAECRSFIASQPLGYFELDARKQGDEETALTLVATLNGGSLAAHLVVIIANVDNYANETFDVLLKTLEEPKNAVTFILLASTLTKVRLTGQSRCQHHRLRPPRSKEARAYLSTLLDVATVKVDEQVLDVLVAESAGKAGKMHADICRIAALPTVTIESVRTAFGHDWVDDVAAFWRAALSSADPLPEALRLPLTNDPRETQRRMQAVLRRLHPSDRDPEKHEFEAALMHRDALIDELTEALVVRAGTLGLQPSDLWGALAQLWLSRDHGDVEGLHWAGRVTQQLLAPMA